MKASTAHAGILLFMAVAASWTEAGLVEAENGKGFPPPVEALAPSSPSEGEKCFQELIQVTESDSDCSEQLIESLREYKLVMWPDCCRLVNKVTAKPCWSDMWRSIFRSSFMYAYLDTMKDYCEASLSPNPDPYAKFPPPAAVGPPPSP